MRPREVVRAWVGAFDRADADALAAFHEEGAVNHQVAEQPVEGRAAIRAMFAEGFARADGLLDRGPARRWRVGGPRWRDPLGLRGCGFFHVRADRIAFQRGYWDKLSFLKLHGLPPPQEPGRP